MRKTTLLFLAILSTMLVYAQASLNIAPYASLLEAHYTASWNRLSAINNKVVGYGYPDVPNEEAWASWIANRPESGWLTYEWAKEYTVNSSTIYFWTDTDAENTGSGVALPADWKIQYWDSSDADWKDVILTSGQSYPRNRLSPNSVSFEEVTTRKMRLFMNASTDGNTYAALGVTEWEVYSLVAEPIITVDVSQVLLSDVKGKSAATFTVKGINLEDGGITLSASDNLKGIEFSSKQLSKANAESEEGESVTVTFVPEKGETAWGTIYLTSGSAQKSIVLVTSKDSGCFTEQNGNLIHDPRFLVFDRLSTWGTAPQIVSIAEGEEVYCGATCLKFEGSQSGIEMRNNLFFPAGSYTISGWVKTNGTMETGVYASNGANGGFSSQEQQVLEQATAHIYFLIPDTKEEWKYFEYAFTLENPVVGGAWFNNDRDKTATLAYLDNWQIYNVDAPEEEEIISGDYPIKPVSFNYVKFADAFWAPRIKMNQEVTIPIALKQCYETGRVDNFKKAAGLIPGYFSTELTFDDTDIYKIIEGMAYSVQTYPNPELDAQMDELIGYIGAAQEEDGYLFTARTAAEPGKMHAWVGAKRWEKDPDLSHELYNCGHLYEAAVAHFEATEKRTLLDIAIKNADLLVKDFLEGGLTYEPGHQIVEMGLVKMYRTTGKEDYLKLAKYFLDLRGDKGVGRKEYSQAHRPVIYQDEAVGHAVRAVYMYSGMADVAALTGNRSYLNAIDKIWDNVTGKKYYITGGIGAKHDGEAFDKNYVLPNMEAYCETCAAIGNVYWNHRMFLLHGDAKYYDVIERTLYNGVISGISLSGDRFFYPNPLESEGQHGRSEWFGCACCPSNLCRFTASIPGYVYAHKRDSLYVNLFVEGTSEIEMEEQVVRISQKTAYPWEGAVEITVNPETPRPFSLLVRVPGWVQSRPVPSDLYSYWFPEELPFEIKVNGETPKEYWVENGYIALFREWKEGDKLEISFPMEVHRTLSNPNVVTNEGKVSLERGPIVYCLEGPDNDSEVFSAVVEDAALITPSYQEDQLNGIVSLRIDGKVAVENAGEITLRDKQLTAIPYYAWANRGAGDMAVWMARSKEYAKAIPEEVPEADTLTYEVRQEPFIGSVNSVYPSVAVQPDMDRVCEIFGLQFSEIESLFDSEITYAAVNRNGSLNTTSTANHPGHWFTHAGNATQWGTDSYLFSEFSLSDFVFNVGQYPNVCAEGDRFTIKQALTYSPLGGKAVRIVFVFNVLVSSYPDNLVEIDDETAVRIFTSGDELHLKHLPQDATVCVYDSTGRRIINACAGQSSYSVSLVSGVYVVSVNEKIKQKIVIY